MSRPIRWRTRFTIDVASEGRKEGERERKRDQKCMGKIRERSVQRKRENRTRSPERKLMLIDGRSLKVFNDVTFDRYIRTAGYAGAVAGPRGTFVPLGEQLLKDRQYR